MANVLTLKTKRGTWRFSWDSAVRRWTWFYRKNGGFFWEEVANIPRWIVRKGEVHSKLDGKGGVG